MRLLYDHYMFSMQRFGGITRYFSELMTNLPKTYSYSFPIKFSENYYAKTINPEIKQLSDILPFRIRRQIYCYYNDEAVKKALKTGSFDLFHPTYYNGYYLKNIKKPLVITIHDMIHEKFPEKFVSYDKTSIYKRLLAEKASHIIAVSQHTKKDIVELYGIDEKKISVVNHGYKPGITPCKQLFDNYILYVGERKGYKNFHIFIESLIPLLKDNPGIKIVCTGKPFTPDELTVFDSCGIRKQMVQISASDEELGSLYKYAKAFVYPSMYEGFGLPILEAFSYGCPVCLSNASCFPEVAEEGGCYFDPVDKVSILQAVSKVVFDADYANMLRFAGNKRLERFSIDCMVEQTCHVYEKCIKQR